MHSKFAIIRALQMNSAFIHHEKKVRQAAHQMCRKLRNNQNITSIMAYTNGKPGKLSKYFFCIQMMQYFVHLTYLGIDYLDKRQQELAVHLVVPCKLLVTGIDELVAKQEKPSCTWETD